MLSVTETIGKECGSLVRIARLKLAKVLEYVTKKRISRYLT